MNEETLLIGFKAICSFVNDLSTEYGKRHKPLKLYSRLVSHTQITHDQAIRKHFVIFHDFCVANREILHLQDASKLVEKKLLYSERVYIDMEHIFHIADAETTPIIWQHLLTISAIVDPAGKAKEFLRKNASNGKNEADFLADVISKVEKNVKPDANPMEAVSSIMQSGIFTELLSGMQGGLQNGKMDVNKLLGAVQGMVSNLSAQAGDDPEAKQAASMLGNVSSMIGNMANNRGNGAPPDMSGMMTMMSTLMSTMAAGQNSPRVEDVSEAKEIAGKKEEK